MNLVTDICGESLKSKPRFILLNPHTHNFFSHSLATFLIGYPNFKKLRYIAECLEDDFELHALVEKNQSSIRRLEKFNLGKLEFYLWRRFFFKRKIKSIDKKNINPEDILFITCKNISYSGISNLNSLKCNFLISTNHYMTLSKKIADELKRFQNEFTYLSELKTVNLSFFKTYFPKKEEITTGYEISSRFSSSRPFEDRENKILALGSITYLQSGESDILLNKKINTYHPDREYLFKNHLNSKLIESKISINNQQSFRENFLTAIFKNFFKFLLPKQKSYYSFDLVKELNNYKFVIYPGDVFDNIPKGVFEAMACGCIVLGPKHHSFSDNGLMDKINYISYGEELNIEKLDNLVEFLINNEKDKLNQISKNSIKYTEMLQKRELFRKVSNLIKKKYQKKV